MNGISIRCKKADVGMNPRLTNKALLSYNYQKSIL